MAAIRSSRAVLLMVAAAALLSAPLWTSRYGLYLLTLIMTYAISALGLNVLKGYAGQVAFAHHAFMALGAYGTAILMIQLRMPLPVALILAALLTMAIGLALAVPGLRLAGFQLAIATLGFGSLVERIIIRGGRLTGGAGGLTLPQWNPAVLGLKASVVNYFVAVTFAVLLFWAVRNMLQTRIGRAWITLRDAELAAEGMGISPPQFKMAAYGISAFYGGIAGGLWANSLSFVAPDHFTMWLTINLLTMVMLGGLGSLLGSVLGAVFFTLLPELLQSVARYQSLVFGIVLALTIGFLPNGLVSLPDRLREVLQRRRRQMTPGGSATPRPERIPFRPSPRFLQRSPDRRADDLVHVQNLGVSFGGLQALDGINLTIGRGERFGLIGPNGAGKTVLFNCLTGFVRPTVGTIHMNGRSIAGLSPWQIARLKVARTFQAPQLISNATVLENVMIGAHRHLRSNLLTAALLLPAVRQEEASVRQKALELLAFLGIPDAAQLKGRELPIATRRLVEIARALLSEPDILFLDEPAAGLTSVEAEELAEILCRLGEETGITLVLIEHQMGMVMKVCQRIAVLNFGVKICEGDAAEVQANPEVIQAYLGGEALAVEG